MLPVPSNIFAALLVGFKVGWPRSYRFLRTFSPHCSSASVALEVTGSFEYFRRIARRFQGRGVAAKLPVPLNIFAALLVGFKVGWRRSYPPVLSNIFAALLVGFKVGWP
jgi:hypothetical protein